MLRPDPNLFNAVTHYPENRANLYAAELAARLEAIRAKAAELAAKSGALPIPADVVDDLISRHERATQAMWQAEGRCASWFIVGPANFPVERERKKTATRDRRAAEVAQHLQAACRRLERIAFPHGMGDAIRSGDPEALTKLRAKLADAEGFHAKMVAANKLIRQYGAANVRPHLETLGFKDRTLSAILKPDYMQRVGFPSFSLSNSSAEIRRIRDRIAGLERMQARGTVETEARAGIRVVENAEAARIQLIFPDKPEPGVRSVLKANGFRWAPSEGAWQRHLNNAGRWAAERVLAALAKPEGEGQ
jgi:hypothetical protein